MCDLLFNDTRRRCPRPPAATLRVETTGEVLSLCTEHANLYEQGYSVTYTPRRPDVHR